MNIFTTDDYNSKDGMLTSIWGPLVWHFLHIISFNYPINPTNQDKQNYKNYLLSLGKILPCKYCRDNFDKNLKKCKFSDKVFKDRTTFSKFIYCFHNEVNKMLDKNIFETYSFVRDRYETFRARCINETPLIPRNTEQGCLIPYYGVKARSIISIVPKNSKQESFQIDNKCKLKKLSKSKKKTKSKSK
jgi:hypothetical protein